MFGDSEQFNPFRQWLSSPSLAILYDNRLVNANIISARVVNFNWLQFVTSWLSLSINVQIDAAFFPNQSARMLNGLPRGDCRRALLRFRMTQVDPRVETIAAERLCIKKDPYCICNRDLFIILRN